ncbi:hypothetical protein ACFLSQ_07990 [Bacteroidota bacterium]
MKYLKLFIIFFISLLVLNEFEANAWDFDDCPEGYDVIKTSVWVKIGEKNCEYDVWLCVKCEFMTHYEGAIGLVCWGPTDPNCVAGDGGEVVPIIESIVFAPDFIATYLCEGIYPPCTNPPSSGFELTTEVPMCWRKYNFEDESIIYERCPDEETCNSVWNLCWDVILEDWNMQRISGPTQSGTPACQLWEPDDPDEDEYSVCFRCYCTECD